MLGAPPNPEAPQQRPLQGNPSIAVATRSPEPKVGHELGHGDGVHQHEVRLAEFQALLLRHGARSGGRAASGGRARAGAGAYGTIGRGRAGERRRALVSARAGSALDGRGRRLPLLPR